MTVDMFILSKNTVLNWAEKHTALGSVQSHVYIVCVSYVSIPSKR